MTKRCAGRLAGASVAWHRRADGIDELRLRIEPCGGFVHLSCAPATLTVASGCVLAQCRGASVRLTAGSARHVAARTVIALAASEVPAEIRFGGEATCEPLVARSVEPGFVRRAREVIESRPQDHPSLDRLASLAGVSKFHLVRQFAAFQARVRHHPDRVPALPRRGGGVAGIDAASSRRPR